MKMTLKKKLILLLLGVGLVPFLSIALLQYNISSHTLNESVQAKLEAVRDAKKVAIERYFKRLQKQLVTTANNPFTQEALAYFDAGFNTLVKNSDAQALSQAKRQMRDYWQSQFAPEYLKQNQTSIDTSPLLNTLDDAAWLLQAKLIANNPKPLGQKNLLEKLSGKDLYAASYNRYHAWFNEFLQNFGLYDIFLVNNEGRVVYSVFKELDFATSLTTGPWKNTDLAKAWQMSKNSQPGQVSLTDFALYTPSYDAPASFGAAPIFANGKQTGTLIFQMPLDTISQVMSARSGMGKTGESYLIGQDKLMRSDSFLAPDTHSVVNSFKNPALGSVKTVSANEVLKGKTGLQVTNDYNGNPVVSAYTPVSYGPFQWGMLIEVDVAEAFESEVFMQQVILISALIGALIITLLGFWFANRLANPIVTLATMMKNVGTHFNFNQAVPVTGNDEIAEASLALNGLLNNLNLAIIEVNQNVDALAHGNFAQRISTPMTGDLALLKEGVNRSSDNIERVMNDILAAMNALSAGQFDFKITAQADGQYADILEQASQSMNRLEVILSEINDTMYHMQMGDFNARIHSEAFGTLNEMKNRFNQSMQAMATAISAISNIVGAQAAGDLTQLLPSGQFKGQLHDLKNAINYSSTKVKEVVSLAINASDVVSGASAEVSQGSSDLSQRVQEQAAALEQTSATMHQMSSQVDSNSQNALQASSMAETVKDKTHNGVALMQQTINAMTAIEDSSKHINDIVNLIDGIAFQTNLLALNAAVEAARAGEHGRGFAVVAGEVRNLAQKSAEAAKDIKELISQTTQRIQQGSSLASESGDMLDEINSLTDQVSNMIAQIAEASEQQAEGVRQVHEAINSIDTVTQQNAALVEETSAAAESLSVEADKLRTAMAYFKTQDTPVRALLTAQQDAK